MLTVPPKLLLDSDAKQILQPLETRRLDIAISIADFFERKELSLTDMKIFLAVESLGLTLVAHKRGPRAVEVAERLEMPLAKILPSIQRMVEKHILAEDIPTWGSPIPFYKRGTVGGKLLKRLLQR